MKIGTIGTGFITDWVLGQMLEYDENEYVAIYSRKEETAQELKQKFHVKKVYTNLDEMYADEEIDTIYVASPNSLHAQHAIKAMRAGKNVICEKPFASNVRECEEMIRVSRETNKFLFEAITTIYTPNYLETKRQLENIGNVRIVQCNMSQYSRKYDAYLEGKNPNVFTSKFSGGALMDLNIYNIHYVVGLFGMPQKVSYYATLNDNGVDLGGVVNMQYPGFVATLTASKNSVGESFGQIQGEKGYLYTNLAVSMMSDLEVHLRSGENQLIDLQQRSGSHYYYTKVMMDVMKENDRQRCDEMLEHTLKIMKIIDMAKESAGIVFDADKE